MPKGSCQQSCMVKQCLAQSDSRSSSSSDSGHSACSHSNGSIDIFSSELCARVSPPSSLPWTRVTLTLTGRLDLQLLFSGLSVLHPFRARGSLRGLLQAPSWATPLEQDGIKNPPVHARPALGAVHAGGVVRTARQAQAQPWQGALWCLV